MSQSRTAVFIDWANAFRGVTINVYELHKFLEGQFGPITGFVYMVDFTKLHKPDNQTEVSRAPEGFWARIRQRFVLRLKKVKVIQREGMRDVHKANWDVGMAMDILKTAQSGKVDHIVVLSGDGDFEPLYWEIRNPPYLIRVTVMARQQQTARELYKCTDKVIDLEPLLSKFSKPYEKRSRREIAEETAATATTGIEPPVDLNGFEEPEPAIESAASPELE